MPHRLGWLLPRECGSKLQRCKCRSDAQRCERGSESHGVTSYMWASRPFLQRRSQAPLPVSGLGMASQIYARLADEDTSLHVTNTVCCCRRCSHCPWRHRLNRTSKRFIAASLG
eukprot:364511-Chlamydomonas_euryale.AAC.3